MIINYSINADLEVKGSVVINYLISKEMEIVLDSALEHYGEEDKVYS